MRFWNAAILLALTAALLWAGGTSADGPLTLEGRTALSLTVSWSWNGQTASAYELTWRARGDDEAAAWRSVRKTTAQRRHTIEGLDAGVHYLVRVRALGFDDRPLASLQGTFSTNSATAGQPLDPRLLRGLAERLTLELESSRELCTAGTLTEISWQISGGKPPYSLEIEGSPVAADADNIRINCGALTEAEAADEDAALAAKRISAVVTDSRGVQQEAALDVARARALPPLQSAEEYGDTVSAYRGAMGFEWHAPAAPYSCRSPNCFAIRWRAVGAEAWTYVPLTHHLDERSLAFGLVRNLADGVVYEAAGAAMRDPIELQTPEALRWTSPLSGTTLTNPTGLTATATHDTVTVRWNRQPSARFWSVDLHGPNGALGQDVVRWDTASWGDPATGVHEVVFQHLPASTRYEVRVGWDVMEGYESTSTKTSVETLPLPPGREPLLRGPQNLRATATHDSITAMWDQPFAAVTDPYWLYLFRGDDEYGASRYGTAWHPNTQFTFSGLKPDMAYRVVVVHMAIVRASAEISVTTGALIETTTLRYNAYDAAGEAAAAGSYAFLSNSGGAADVVATYEGLRDGTAKLLLIHKADAQGVSRTTLYDAVAAGDFFEWREANDCWVRYRVTEVKPDPPAAAPRKLLAVEWTTYAFTGCSGAITADAAIVFDWGPLPNLGGPALTAPIVHGPYQLVPEGWRGAVQEPRTYDSPGYSATNPTYTRDLATARQLPYWRDPALPAGWTFSWATAGDVSGPTYGYWAVFATERGKQGVTIFGYYADYRGHPEEASWRNARGAFETRIIAGRPARVAYSPPGPSHFDLFPVTVWIYDPSTETEYAVLGQVKRPHGANVDAIIAIARSLFEGAD